MLVRERLFRIQIFQYTLSTLYMYPIRLYKNDCYENFFNLLSQDEQTIKRLTTLLNTDKKQIIPSIKKALKSDPLKYSEPIYDILNSYSEDLRSFMWFTRHSNSLAFTRELKSNKALWLHLMLYALFDKEYIEQNFNIPHIEECLVEMKSIYVKLDQEYTIVIGRLFEREQNTDKIIQNIINNFKINNIDIFEMTKLAQKRNFFEIAEVKEQTAIIKKAFKLFLDIVDELPPSIPKKHLEKIAIFTYMQTQKSENSYILELDNFSLSCKNNKLHINYNKKNKNAKESEALYKKYYQKYLLHRSFSQNEFTSRLKSSLAKKYTTFNEDNEFTPIDEVIQRVCGSLNADGGCYIKYNLSRQTFKRAAKYGDKEYILGISKYITKINKNDKATLKKSRVLKIVNNYYNDKPNRSISDMIIFNYKENALLQPVPNKPIYSNIAIPITFKHKLLGILLIDSFRKNSFTKNDIQLVLSITNALSVQIYDNIVEKKLFAIIENIPNKTQLDDTKDMKNRLMRLTRYINSIFFSIGVEIWVYQHGQFKRVSSTLENELELIINENESALICELSKKDVEEVSDEDLRSSKKLFHSKAYEKDKRINAVKIYAIRDENNLIGAISIYNKRAEDYNTIDNTSLKSVKNHLKIYFSTIRTFEKQRELIHSNALHDISQNLNMIYEKCIQLTTLLNDNFRDIDKYTRYRFGIKIKDIESFQYNTKLSFKYITGEGKTFFKQNSIDKQIEQLYANIQKKISHEVKLQDIIYRIINSIPYKHKNLKLRANIDDINVKIAPVILEDIFSNLIQNAIKYSYQNTTIQIRTIPLKYITKIYIENIGIEIKEDEIDDIFEYGYRGFEALEFEEEIGEKKISYPRGQSENSGFGLYKCKKLVKFFDGTIKLQESQRTSKGYKNRFVLTIPAKMINQNRVMKEMSESLSKKFQLKG